MKKEKNTMAGLISRILSSILVLAMMMGAIGCGGGGGGSETDVSGNRAENETVNTFAGHWLSEKAVVGMGGSLKDRRQGRAFPFIRALSGMNDPRVEMLVFFRSHVIYSLNCSNWGDSLNNTGRRESALSRQSGHWSMAG